MNDADNITTCGNCGKGEENSGDLKACTACKLVKYCNRECQIAHRPLHKKACKKRAAELHDEALFKEHPPREDCPICMLPLPLGTHESVFQSCCGKIICAGCIHVMDVSGGNDICAFCREPTPSTDGEVIQRMKKCSESGKSLALYNLAGFYERGNGGMPQDMTKANELFLTAGELGCAEGYCNLGYSYMSGMGVEMDKKKAKHYWELAAMNGSLDARHNLGCMELEAGNEHRALKHFILSAKAGYKKSLNNVKAGFMNGIVTKDEYENTLRSCQDRYNEMKSDDRDRAVEEL